MPQSPILWSFRRCPYAIRARLALHVSHTSVDLREILLRDKPQAFRAASISGTVPCLEADVTLDESRDIMLWALRRNDPHNWLARASADAPLIDRNDGAFKSALDHTKYAVRFPDLDPDTERAKASAVLHDLNARLTQTTHLTGDTFSLADAAILPFVRQFAHIDRPWFDAQDWPHLIRWLDAFLASPRFAAVMLKYPPWQPGGQGASFP